MHLIYQKKLLLFLGIVLLLGVLSSYTLTGQIASAQNAPNLFTSRKSSSLMLNGKNFRFSGANIYWLGLQEAPLSYPSDFRVDDALATAALMGATVVRSHTLGISVGCDLCVEPTLGQFNQTALQHIDYAVESAHLHNIKLIIPLTDNWHYYHGGKHTFTDWRDISDENQFYYNSTVINDFKLYISTILNHVNVYTGIAYKNDPTILAWETGNELSAPATWVQNIATYIKSIDHNHLVMDGNDDQGDSSSNFSSDLSISAVDIYTSHYYPPNTKALSAQVQQTIRMNKAFVIGEYDWNANSPDNLGSFLSAIQHSQVTGDLYWSLFPHNDTYGFVPHNDPYTLHYPGDTPDMRKRVTLISTHAYAMAGLSLPKTNPPGTPYITSVNNGLVAWRGAFGGATYSVESSTTSTNGPWTIICNQCATDNDTPWTDPLLPNGQKWYRVRAYSVWGVPGPYSNVYWAPAYYP